MLLKSFRSQLIALAGPTTTISSAADEAACEEDEDVDDQAIEAPLVRLRKEQHHEFGRGEGGDDDSKAKWGFIAVSRDVRWAVESTVDKKPESGRSCEMEVERYDRLAIVEERGPTSSTRSISTSTDPQKMDTEKFFGPIDF
ncbi:unnamed protein product, partial [Mesorhabditis spiculigera]